MQMVERVMCVYFDEHRQTDRQTNKLLLASKNESNRNAAPQKKERQASMDPPGRKDASSSSSLAAPATTATTTNETTKSPKSKGTKRTRPVDAPPTGPMQQSSMLNFFSTKKTTSTSGSSSNKKRKQQQQDIKEEPSTTSSSSSTVNNNDTKNNTSSEDKEVTSKEKEKAETSTKPTSNNAIEKKTISTTAKAGKDNAATEKDGSSSSSALVEPWVPRFVSTPRTARWSVHKGCVLVRTVPSDKPRPRVAAFDMDNTLLVWTCPRWPSQFDHYELWSRRAVGPTLRRLYDDEGCKLVIVSNQGGIRKALTGKIANRTRALIDWLEHDVIQRPVHAVVSTNNGPGGYHKPNPALWQIMERYCNGGLVADRPTSFYVGDSVLSDPNDAQGGVDERFAQNVGQLVGTPLGLFQHPQDYFGPNDLNQRTKHTTMAQYQPPPPQALHTMASLWSGYLATTTTTRPILLILCGVQGSGKTTFCQRLVSSSSSKENDDKDTPCWVHLSQDTIRKGKPGKREAVQAAALEALTKQGHSVVVDRTHLDASQRRPFVELAQKANVSVHAVWLQASKETVAQRVRERTNHPGGVEGERGAKLALAAMARIQPPHYQEGFSLISISQNPHTANRLADLYKQSTTSRRPSFLVIAPGVDMPTLALGTMGMGKRATAQLVQQACQTGYKAVDTAPTYQHENHVGLGMTKDVFCIVKVPKRATTAQQVRTELETSLAKLQRPVADLLLLHWPSNAETLEPVWKEMELLVKENKLCRSIGVCNFGVNALRMLLPLCEIPPAVNQVERHPLLPQWELLQFCSNHGIAVQAHTPLGQGQLLRHDGVSRVAKDAGLTPAQALLAWNLQHGVAVVTKASSTQHQLEGLEVLNKKNKSLLSSAQMKELDSLSSKSAKRFVAPPFMYGPGIPYAWGDRVPK